ncbi:hypothetical protein PHLGIDRAFT_325235 [Phlebiopsis gigantea 11061_1 CR5-6]|uniref:F-box domain-containing protein n=1 Tax=Phlebiopsis gigantea (strain 11061_1 CR5-6) TaxID=745531 RepID=A0A0C3NBL8_PHLG1|nr:hypothetical protein PHLGIDRAFT_325235 [Phlebiopsis gigantea 11061_1 CR5-6]
MPQPSHDVIARRHTNALQPISRLPNELLTLIFRIVRDYEELDDRTSHRWMKVLRVCRHWYILGVNVPLLWTTVTLRGGKDCVEAILARSRDALLDVNLDDAVLCDADAQSCTNEVLKEAHRLRSLKMTLHPTYWNPSGFEDSPGMLEILDLTVRYNFKGGQLSVTKIFDASSDWPFTSGLPSLHTLALSVDRSIHGVLQIPGLRSLHIQVPRSRMGDAFSESPDFAFTYKLRDLLASLDGMPLLEDVKLSWCIPSNASEITRDKKVRLANLECLVLVDRDIRVSHFLSFLDLPTSASIKLDVQASREDHLLSLVHAIPPLFTSNLPEGAHESRTLRSLTMQVQAVAVHSQTVPTMLYLTGCTCDHACLCGGVGIWYCPDHNFRIQIFYCHDRFAPWTRFVGLRELFALLPFDQVHTLLVQGFRTSSALQLLGWDDLEKLLQPARSRHFDILPDSKTDEFPEMESIREQLSGLSTLCFA